MQIQNMEKGRQGWEPSREEVSEFLRSLPLCSFATLGPDGGPQIARVAFSETVEHDFIVGTSETSRKALNVQRNPRVSIETTDENRRFTVQIEGLAHILTATEFEPYAEEHYNQLPASRPFRDEPGQVNILVTPYFVRFSDCSVHPWLVSKPFNH
jgi:hypothetical protein